MESRSFGITRRRVPVVGQGTWSIDEAVPEQAAEVLRAGIELGMTHIDTAEMYGDAELRVAAAIDGRREHIFLVDKVLRQHAARSDTLRACRRSLGRLRTDRLDCYLLHWRGSVPLAETSSRRQRGASTRWKTPVPEVFA